MIKLNKLAKPQILIDNETTWTAELMAKYAAGQKPTAAEATRYRHATVKATLVEETYGKCAYCESKLQHIHHGDVEHIFPKSLARGRTFEWENLTLACEICNQNKSNKDPNAEHILDPYVHQPSDYLIFLGSLVYPIGETPYGKSSEVILDLNRTKLLEMRREWLEKVMAIFEHIQNPNNPIEVRKAIFQNLLVNEGAAKGQYSAMVNSAINAMKPTLPAAIIDEV